MSKSASVSSAIGVCFLRVFSLQIGSPGEMSKSASVSSATSMCFCVYFHCRYSTGGHGKNEGGVAVAADGLHPQPAHLHEKALGGTLNELLHGPHRVHCLVVCDTYA